MLISVKSRNGVISDALKQHVDRKFQKLEKFFHHIESAEMEVSHVRGIQIVEFSIQGDNITLRSEERCNDLNLAVDNALNKMETQIKNFKTRVRRSHQRPGPVKEIAAEKSVLLTDSTSDDENELKPLVISRRKRFPMKPMPAEEAAIQMELLDHDFFLFLNEQTGEVNVLYRRKDGDYGMIEPEF